MSNLTRAEAQAAVAALGWRYILGTLRSTVAVRSLPEAAAVAAHCPDGPISLDLRRDRVLLSIHDVGTAGVDLARRVTEALRAAGLTTVPSRTQQLEIAIDALDIARLRPFWRAVLAYVDTPGGPDEYGAALLDPLGVTPAVWFQHMDVPRPQRNRIHLDISVPHEEAESRVAAALAAGGILVSDTHAPAFWVLADAEGNEACITTWQSRD
ncbi:VOC family protein [Dactylosporangium sp. CA-233914]|uniref:VOC family protein n=1 Tax=Dactylosporangium sp. CA-233914 TaxID=3239934 RepID=UPI003D93221F